MSDSKKKKEQKKKLVEVEDEDEKENRRKQMKQTMSARAFFAQTQPPVSTSQARPSEGVKARGKP